MAMSVWARMGAATGDEVYFETMHRNFQRAVTGFGLWSERDSLFYRDPPAKRAHDQEGVFWSRGNGWAAGALVAALRHAAPPGGPPPASPARARAAEGYAWTLRRLAARLVSLQGGGVGGCWPVSLTDPGFFKVPETTGTAMFVHALAYGVRAGLLDARTHLPAVRRGWECLSRVALQPSGRVGWCQSGGDRPHRNIKAEITSDFCVGMFALAAAEVAQLAG
jgi:rhamnogalacturonyl hydrolase YesR